MHFCGISNQGPDRLEYFLRFHMHAKKWRVQLYFQTVAANYLRFAANFPSDERVGFQEVSEHTNHNSWRVRHPNFRR